MQQINRVFEKVRVKRSYKSRLNSENFLYGEAVKVQKKFTTG